MKVLTLANNKGGVGKTKFSKFIAEYMAKFAQQKVLLVDFDSQANLSSRYLAMEIDPSSKRGKIPPIHPDYDPTNPEDADWDGRSSIADIFYGDGVIPYPTAIENLDIAPAWSSKLLDADATRPAEQTEKIHFQLKKFLASPDVRDAYDLVMVDTAPSQAPTTIAGIKAATHMIIPLEMEEESIEGLFAMLQLWMQESLERDADSQLELVGILPNKVDKKTNLHTGILQSLKDNAEISKYIMPLTISRRIVFAENSSSEADPKSIFDLKDSNPAKQELMALCQFVASKVITEKEVA